MIEGMADESVNGQTRDRYAVPLPNGAPVAIEVDTPADATVVMVDTKSAILDLQKVAVGRWAGTFLYYNADNTGDPHSNITVRVAGARSSVEKVVSVITLHDS